MTRFFVHDIIRRRAPLVDDGWGNLTRDWNEAVDTPLFGVNVQPNTQAEDDTPLRTVVVTSWRIQSAPGTDLDLLPSDRVIHDGIVCDVVGEVARWPAITGGVHHVEVTVERSEG